MKYKLPDKVTEVMDKIRNEGYEIYAVGGCVRNMILKIKIKQNRTEFLMSLKYP